MEPAVACIAASLGQKSRGRSGCERHNELWGRGRSGCGGTGEQLAGARAQRFSAARGVLDAPLASNA